jgi:hypothetical protein
MEFDRNNDFFKPRVIPNIESNNSVLRKCSDAENIYATKILKN